MAKRPYLLIAAGGTGGHMFPAQALAEAMGHKGGVVMLRYKEGSESTEQRERGFLDEMKQHPGIQIVLADRYGGPDESRAVEVAESVMASMGTELDGVFCSNEPCTSGFLTVLERDPRKLADKLVVVGFDSGAKINAALASGLLEGTVLQDPVAIGYEAVRAMHAVLSKQPVQKRTSTRQALATPANMATPEIRALLFPLESP